jgi:hypothetical protein
VCPATVLARTDEVIADVGRIEMPHCGKSSLLTNLLSSDLGFGAPDAICSTETT